MLIKKTFSVNLEKEVSLSELIKEVRRIDGQRISVPIFDCFFICKSFSKTACKGSMFYIMEKGNHSMSDLIKKKTNRNNTKCR